MRIPVEVDGYEILQQLGARRVWIRRRGVG